MIMITDCNAKQLGGILMQIDDSGVERPIAFHSRRLNKAELKYGITDREALAGVECAKKFQAQRASAAVPK